MAMWLLEEGPVRKIQSRADAGKLEQSEGTKIQQHWKTRMISETIFHHLTTNCQNSSTQLAAITRQSLRIFFGTAYVNANEDFRHKTCPNSTWLVTSSHDTTRHVRRVERVETSVSSRAVRQARHSQNAWARHVERVVSCRDVTSQVEFGLYPWLVTCCCATTHLHRPTD